MHPRIKFISLIDKEINNQNWSDSKKDAFIFDLIKIEIPPLGLPILCLLTADEK